MSTPFPAKATSLFKRYRMAGILLERGKRFPYNERVMIQGHRTNPWRMIFLLLLGAGVLSIAWLIARGQGKRHPVAAPAHSSQESLSPGALSQPLMGGLILLTAEQMAKVPWVDGFQSPCGAPHGAMTYSAQTFGSPNAKRGGRHTGDDINGIGGQNTDEGEPVCAAGRGLVIYSGTPSADWGQVIVLAHRLPGESDIIQTLYAHLKERHVRTGQVVSRGEKIGSIGTADGRYLAHLHFEAIRSRCTEAGMPGYCDERMMNRIDPSHLLRQYPAPDIPDTYQEFRHIRLREAALHAPDQPVQLPKGSIPVTPSQFL